MQSPGTPSTPPGRAGRYIRQPTGYSAFIPQPLPPDPPVRFDTLQVLLSQADRVLGRLDGAIQTLPNPDLFVSMYVRREAVLSSQIEGTQSSLHDVLAAEAKIFAPDQPTDVGDVINHIAAMHHGLERLAKLPLSVRLIREIHTVLLRNARGSHLNPGELRSSQNWIGAANCTLAEATFIPPPPQELAPQLSALEKFLHAETGLPLLIKIGLAHAQFETIHPFLDGNGRIGRLLITFILCEREVLHKPVLYLSHYFKKHRQQYYDSLQAVRDTGDWEQWLAFFLRGIIAVSGEATETTRHILLLRERHREAITERFGRAAGNGHRVLEYLYTHPIVAVAEVQELTGTSYPAANNLVARMTEADILHEITGNTRNRIFAYRNYIDLFHDPIPETM